MGFFSFMTADTNESIPSHYSGRNIKPVYMLQPNGEHICEPFYEGYGVFGGVDCYQWVAENNPDNLKVDIKTLNDEEKRLAGIGLCLGSIYIDVRNEELWSIFHDERFIVETKHHKGTYDDFNDDLGGTPNDLIAKGILKEIPIKSLSPLKHPLKFSFDKNASYWDLPGSEECPHQGYFYDF